MRALNKLSSAFVKSAPVGKHNDGGGLWLHKRPDGGAQWFFRFDLHGRRHEMGLGGYPAVGLKGARDERDRWRSDIQSGKNPIRERERQRREAARSDNTFQAVTLEAFEARKAELKDDGKAGRWLSPLEHHVLPKLGGVPVEDIDQRDIRDVLAPLWHEKAETARKALNRISIVLKHAAAMGLDVDLQATEKARALLGQSRHVAKNIPSMPWQEVPAFYATLGDEARSHLALRLYILLGGGVRLKPLRCLHLDQIDGDVWTVPADTLKGRKNKTSDYRMPLSAEALHVIELARPFARDGFLFANETGSVVSDVAVAKPMKVAGLEARPHGFRTSIRVWLAEATDAPHEVAEAMIAHVADSTVVRTYRKTDYLEQRRVLLERWASHVTGGTSSVVKSVEVN